METQIANAIARLRQKLGQELESLYDAMQSELVRIEAALKNAIPSKEETKEPSA